MPQKSFHKWLVLLGTGISSIIAAIDLTIVNTALATFQRELSATISELQWIMAGFGVTFCAFLAIVGRISDIFGRRLILYIGMAGFGLSSVAAGFSESAWELIVFRLLQGAFGATIFPCGLALTAAVFPKEQRGKATGIYGSFLGIGLAFGPVVGSAVLAVASWRWIFFINVPIILLSFLLCIFVVKESKAEKKIPVDWIGGLLIVFGLGILVFGFTEADTYGWGSWIIIVSLVVAALLFVAIVWYEDKSSHPIVPFHLFRNKGVFLGTIALIASISFIWPIFFLLPLYLQNVLEYSTTQTGWVLFTMTIMTVITPPIVGQVYDKIGETVVLLAMFVFIFGGYILQLFFGIDGPLGLIVVAFVCFGIAWGWGNGIGTPLVLSRLSSTENAATVTGGAITILNVVGVSSLAIITTIFKVAQKSHFKALIGQENLALTAQKQSAVKVLLSNPEKGKQLLAQFGTSFLDQIMLAFKKAFVFGFRVILIILLGISLILFLVTIFGLWKKESKTEI